MKKIKSACESPSTHIERLTDMLKLKEEDGIINERESDTRGRNKDGMGICANGGGQLCNILDFLGGGEDIFPKLSYFFLQDILFYKVLNLIKPCILNLQGL